MKAIQGGASGDAIDSGLGEEGSDTVARETAEDVIPEFIGCFCG